MKTFSDSKNPLSFKSAIIDIRMSNIKGIQLYQILKILNPALRILFITSLDAVNEILIIFPDIKSTDIIRKPVEESQVIKIANNKVLDIGTN
ncbi:MAG: response regulator [Candidatus Nitrosocosmicus sp.]